MIHFTGKDFLKIFRIMMGDLLCTEKANLSVLKHKKVARYYVCTLFFILLLFK